MRIIITLFILLMSLSSCSASNAFDANFQHKTLRLDWILAGDAHSSQAFFSAFHQEPHWGGSEKQLIDSTGFGQYRLLLIDDASGDTIYSHGFCTLFQEWQSTPDAKKIQRAFQQTAIMPFPRKSAMVVIEERKKDLSFSSILKVPVKPESPDIKCDALAVGEAAAVEVNGKPSDCVDIAFVPEGYTASEQDKFIADVRRLSDYLFTLEPYKRYRQHFNIHAVKVISLQSGTDDPRKNHWVSTPFNTGFNALGIDRYLLTDDVFELRNAAACVPYDQIVILVNSPMYGGAGIFNHFLVVTADHAESLPVFAHEFGHTFAGLADEYYTSEVSYSDFVDKTTEPWYPNITTLVDFDNKWKSMLNASTPVPTPNVPEWQNKVGVFEGAAYSEKGIYRPTIDCRMKTNNAPGFCPVCSHTIEKIISQLTQ